MAQRPNASVSGAFDVVALVLHLLEHRAFVQLQADPERDRQQHDRDQERDAPAPGLEGVLADRGAAAEDHEQRQEQAERRRGLDPAGVEAALAVRRMLGDIGRRAAVFAAQRQALQQAQRDQRRSGAATPIDA